MTRIYGVYEDEKEVGNFEPTSDDQCEFQLTEKEWEYINSTDCQVQEWHCPYPSLNDSIYCPLHENTDLKKDTDVIAFINNLISEYDSRGRYEFLGTKVGAVDLSMISLDDIDPYSTLDFRNSIIEGDISAEQRIFQSGFDFSGSIVKGEMGFYDSSFKNRLLVNSSLFLGGSVFLSRCTFEDKVEFNNSVFQTNVHVTGSTFLEEANFGDSIFCLRSTFQLCDFHSRPSFSDSEFLFESSDNESATSFHGSKFEDSLSFNGVRFNGVSEWRETTVHGSLVFPGAKIEAPWICSHSEIERLDLINAHISEGIDFIGTSIGEIAATGLELSNESSQMRFNDGELLDGFIYQPNEGKLQLDFSGATLGDVKFKPDPGLALLNMDVMSLYEFQSNGKTIFNQIRFFKTKFEGFQFEEYYPELDSVDWTIHQISGEEINEMSHELRYRRGDQEGSVELEGEVMTPGSLMATYSYARNGASDVGASKIASEFFVKEMKYRKAYHRNNFFRSIGSVSHVWDLWSVALFGSRWFINSFIELVSGYGERLWAPVLYSLLLIINFAMLFPLVGGVSDGETIYSIANVGEIGINTLMFKSLYFSTITFTTLGYGDLQPVGNTSQLLAGLESLAGSFLLALLIFTLGRKIVR